MTAKSLDGFITISDVLSSSRATNGSILLQVGDVLSGEVERSDAECYGVPGIISVPANPTATQASAEVMTLRYGDRALCVAGRDLVSQSLAGALNPGETAVYAPGANGQGQARILLKDTGDTSSITIYTTEGNVSDGSSIAIQATSEGKINLAASTYGALTMSSDGITMAAPSAPINILSGGKVNITASGLTLNVGATLNVAALTAWITQVSIILGILANAPAANGAPPSGAIAALPTATPIG